jgi:uncharacterized repeat protein (TIGR01451 family)
MNKVSILVLSALAIFGIAVAAGNVSASDCNCGSGSGCNLGVDAGSDFEIDEGQTVRLDGSVSGDYTNVGWSCTGGILSDGYTLRPSFKISGYDDYSGQTYTCTLTAYNSCGSDSDSVKIRSTATRGLKSLRVALISRPKGECAPLQNVDLVATLYEYGGYDGDYTYRFDCENDGIWDKTATTEDTEYIATDLCDYINPGGYTARAEVSAGSRIVADTEIVSQRNCANSYANNYNYYNNPPSGQGHVSITKTVRNVTRGSGYQGTVTANPGDIVSYKIIVTADAGALNNIVVSDALPGGITNIRDLMIDGANPNGSLSSGINIGGLLGGQTRVITYTATVAGAYNFTYGQATLTNTATVAVGGNSANSSAAVQVYRNGLSGATMVSTGVGGNTVMGLMIALSGILMASWLFYRRRIKRILSSTINRFVRIA